MNKKQKIFWILGLTLILSLTGIPLLTKAGISPGYDIYKLGKAAWQYYLTGDVTGAAQTLGGGVPLAQYIAGTIGGYLVQAAAFFTDFALKINFRILDADFNPFVSTGWSISRDLANLGFVLFIIIIAIATILRYQEYAAKSTLAKLIAVALLVNFSLMGAGVFVDFSNMLTNFFITKATGGTSWSASENWSFATKIAGVFNLGSTLKVKSADSGLSIKGLLEGAFTAVVAWIASLFFVIIFTLLLAFVLFALAIMFLIRYIALNVLLVLVPLACLFWVIPATKSLWEKWWSNFMRWILFAPAASFFLFLALRTVIKFNEITNTPAGEAFLAGGETKNTQQFAGLVNYNLPVQIANGVMLVGFVLGGLMVANSLGITGAKTFYGWAQAAGKGARAFAGRKGVQYGTALLRRKGTEEGAKSIAERTQAWAAARKTGVGRYAAGWVARGTTRLATAGGEDQIKYHEKQVADMSIPDTKAALLTAFGPRKIALINKLTKANQSGNIDMTRIATEDTKKLFARFGQHIVFGNTEKAGLMSVEMNEARVKDDAKMLLEKTESLIAKFTKKDVEPAAWKDMFSGKAKFGLDEKSLKKQSQYIAKALSTKNPGLVANIIPKLDSTSRINFVEAYRDALKGVSKETSDAFEKTMANYAVGFSPIEAAAETAKT